jgi:cytochrome c553
MKHMTQFFFLVVAVFFFWGLMASADNHDKDDEDEGEDRHDRYTERRSVAAPVDQTYKAECGSCHMVYPPGLLPTRSWVKIMGNLQQHFGENASIEKETADKIQKVLTENSADRVINRRSQKIAKSIASSDTPLRISETLYFTRQHHEVGAKIWSRKSIGSAANCVACHSRAEQGVFSEDEIRVPR